MRPLHYPVRNSLALTRLSCAHTCWQIHMFVVQSIVRGVYGSYIIHIDMYLVQSCKFIMFVCNSNTRGLTVHMLCMFPNASCSNVEIDIYVCLSFESVEINAMATVCFHHIAYVLHVSMFLVCTVDMLRATCMFI